LQSQNCLGSIALSDFVFFTQREEKVRVGRGQIPLINKRNWWNLGQKVLLEGLTRNVSRLSTSIHVLTFRNIHEKFRERGRESCT
jgi:hypothetical protein